MIFGKFPGAFDGCVALAAGGHTYEFLATDDIAPAMDKTWLQVGQPGNGLYNDYYQTTPYFLKSSFA